MVDRPNPTPSDLEFPDGTLTPGELPGAVTQLDVDQAREWMRRDLEGPLARLTSGFRDGLIGGIGDLIRGVVRPGWETFKPVADRQKSLNDRTDLLSPLLDYGSCHMERVSGWTRLGSLPFTEQLGPMRNVEILPDGGFRLLDMGLWDIRAQITMSWVAFIDQTVQFRIVVRDPDGGFHSEQVSVTAGSIRQSHTPSPIISSVAVDEPGFTVQVEIQSNAAGRAILGGPAYSRLTVQHISRNVSGTDIPGGEEDIVDPIDPNAATD